MAFDIQGFSTPNTKGLNLWLYNTSDNIATVEGANYFDDVADSLNVGDTIIAVMGDGKKIYNVDAISAAGAVTVVAANDGSNDIVF
jgi:hypothetical protein